MGVARYPYHRMGDNFAGFHNAEAMALIKAARASVGRIVDQAQTIQPELLGARLSMPKKLHTQPLVAPAFVQRQAGDVQRIQHFHIRIRRQYRIGGRRRFRIFAHGVTVHHANDAPFRLGDETVLPGKIHIVAGITSLPDVQQRLSGRVEQVLGASREEWRLAEAEHLLRMAMLRLSAMQDVKSAEMLVHEADLILQKQDDPAAYATRQKLLEGLEGLRSLPDLDRTGLFLQLGALRGQTSRLSALAPEFINGESLSGDAVQSRWQRWLDELMRYVRIDFDAGTNVKPLLAGQSLAQVQLALSLAIEQAQWAVLNGNTEVYQQSLEQARSMLQDHFNEDNGDARGLRQRIEALAGRQVAVALPDLAPALKALQVYVQKRETPDSSEPEQPAAETEQEAQRT